MHKFGDEYLREPTADDVNRQLSINESRGFPGMFGSLDCTHLNWDKCPVAQQGQYQDRNGKRSIVAEAVCSQDLWIWHCYIGIPGSNNDVNIVDRSPLMGNLLRGIAPHCQYVVNGVNYEMSYLLVDGIYPNWPIFMKTISQPQGRKRQLYSKMQEALRKDIERAFGVLQARFAMLKNPCRLLDINTIIVMWRACIILHNMIIQDERDDTDTDTNLTIEVGNYVRRDHAQRRHDPMTFESLVQSTVLAQDESKYFALRNDIVEHLWSNHGDQ